MSDLVLRPRSATELIDAAFQIYQRAPLPFMVAMALIYVPWLGVRLLFKLYVPPGQTQLTASMMTTLVVTSVGGIIIYCVAAGAGFVIARAVYLDEPVDVAAAFRLSFARFPKLLLTTILEFVLAAIGFVFLFVPGIYLLLRFFAVRQTVMLEDAGPIAAFARSSTLSRGHKWHVFGTLLLIMILALVVDGGAAVVVGLLGSHVLEGVLMTAVVIVVYPLIVITETVLYFDTRIRNEGFDVEYLAAAPSVVAAPGLPA